MSKQINTYLFNSQQKKKKGMSNFNKTIIAVVKSGLCTGCGTCAGVCPQNAVEMIIDSREGSYLPVINEDKCNACGLCFEICPGHSVDFNHYNRELFGKELGEGPLGNHLNCYMGQAANYNFRYNAASGGVVTALLTAALEEGLIDGALVTKMQDDRPLEPQPFIARTRKEIIAASKSKYCTVPANVALKKILEEEGKYAVVCLPCHIQGIRKASSVIKELKKRVVLCVSLHCSHNDTLHFTKFLLSRYSPGRDIDDITHLDCRGLGWPGALAIRFKDGAVKCVPYYRYIAFHNLWFFAPRRCVLCCDSFSRLSDITVMGALLLEKPAKYKTGTSLLIARSQTGQWLCNQAKNKRFVELEAVSSTELIRPQGKEHLFNRDLPAFLLLRRVFGKQVPNYGLKLPHSGPINWLHALLVHCNIWLSIKPSMSKFIHPLAQIEDTVFRALTRIFRR